MSYIFDEIEQAARGQGVSMTRCGDASRIRNEIYAKYTNNGEKYTWIWDVLKGEQYAIYGSEKLSLLSLMPFPKEVIIFFNDCDDREMGVLSDSGKLYSIIMDCFGFEFYVTDRDTSFLVCNNHHDMLIGCGLAKDWLQEANNKGNDGYSEQGL